MTLEQAKQAGTRAAEALADSAALAEEHARRAEAQGNHDRAVLEWARAAWAREAAARARRH